jgi:very-short-patch-repair endonuclease
LGLVEAQKIGWGRGDVTRSAFGSDHHRDATLAAHGYTTLRFTGRQLKYKPLAVIATVARALG